MIDYDGKTVVEIDFDNEDFLAKYGLRKPTYVDTLLIHEHDEKADVVAVIEVDTSQLLEFCEREIKRSALCCIHPAQLIPHVPLLSWICCIPACFGMPLVAHWKNQAMLKNRYWAENTVWAILKNGDCIRYMKQMPCKGWHDGELKSARSIFERWRHFGGMLKFRSVIGTTANDGAIATHRYPSDGNAMRGACLLCPTEKVYYPFSYVTSNESNIHWSCWSLPSYPQLSENSVHVMTKAYFDYIPTTKPYQLAKLLSYLCKKKYDKHRNTTGSTGVADEGAPQQQSMSSAAAVDSSTAHQPIPDMPST